MPGGRVDQLLAGFADGDAISSEAVLMREVFRAQGFDSDIYVDPARIGRGVVASCRSIGEYDGGPADTVIYHYAIASAATDAFLGAKAAKIVRYHNITPASFFDGYADQIAAQLRAGRDDLRRVCESAGLILADSAFNASELGALGLRNVRVVPLLFSPDRSGVAPDPRVLAKLGGPLRNILFVGRMAPNKCVEELIRAFAWYNRTIDPYSRLVLVGSERSCPAYFSMLRFQAYVFELPNVCFEGFASAAGLAACYANADVFVCASEHEGYGLPLLEAMHHEIPVVAKDRGAVAETLGGAGVLYDGLTPRELAELLHIVLTDASCRAEILRSQARRMAEVRARDFGAELGEMMNAE